MCVTCKGYLPPCGLDPIVPDSLSSSSIVSVLRPLAGALEVDIAHGHKLSALVFEHIQFCKGMIICMSLQVPARHDMPPTLSYCMLVSASRV